jgi:methylmalonyl-CoA mutase N-terminal domain/subunit
MSEGEVGKCGVAIDSLADMETLFQGIPLDRISTSMTTNAPGGDHLVDVPRSRRKAGRRLG